MEQKLSIDELLEIGAPDTFLVRADGESMVGTGIFDGDVMVVSRALRAGSGDIVIAAINGDTRLITKVALACLKLVYRKDFLTAKLRCYCSYFWSIDASWLSDCTVSATARIGNDLEHVNAVLQPLG